MNLNATIIGQTISFIFFVWFCMKYVWPPIIFSIETRQKEIKESLISAKKAQDELFITKEKISQKIKEAKQQASIILKEANKQKALILEEARKNALEESKKIIRSSEIEIEIKVTNARKKLHKEIVDLSIIMAEKILKKNISNNDNQDLVDELIISLSQVKK